MIKETLRIAQPHTAMRRNLGPEMYIDGKVIPTGAYVVYPFSDVHLNPEIYPDPWKFDPAREEIKTQFGYVGWGGGPSAFISSRVFLTKFRVYRRKNNLSWDKASQSRTQAHRSHAAAWFQSLGSRRDRQSGEPTSRSQLERYSTVPAHHRCMQVAVRTEQRSALDHFLKLVSHSDPHRIP